MQENKADLERVVSVAALSLVVIAAAGAQCKHHDQGKKQCCDLLHLRLSSNKFIYYQNPVGL